MTGPEPDPIAPRRLPARGDVLRTARQFISFGVIGGSGVVVNMAVVVACRRLGPHWNEVLAPIVNTPYSVRLYHVYVMVAFLVANSWNFALNRRFTFEENRHVHWWRQYLPFLLVGLVGQVVGLLVVTLLLNPTSPLALPTGVFDESTGLRTPLYWAQLISILIVTPLTFASNKFWTFTATGVHVRRRRSRDGTRV